MTVGVGTRNLARASVSTGRSGPGQHFQALGRLKPGQMNQTEARYAEHLEARRRAGEIQWFRFSSEKLRLATNTFYSPDFTVLLADGRIQHHEVKGARAVFQDDARVKIKVAAEIHPFPFFVAFPRPARDGGGWDVEEIR